jgi:hypothetical protein
MRRVLRLALIGGGVLLLGLGAAFAYFAYAPAAEVPPLKAERRSLTPAR